MVRRLTKAKITPLKPYEMRAIQSLTPLEFPITMVKEAVCVPIMGPPKTLTSAYCDENGLAVKPIGSIMPLGEKEKKQDIDQN